MFLLNFSRTPLPIDSCLILSRIAPCCHPKVMLFRRMEVSFSACAEVGLATTMGNIICPATFLSLYHLAWAGFSQDFLQTEVFSSHFCHGMLNIFFLYHVYAVCTSDVNSLVNKCELLKAWAASSSFLHSQRRFFMSNEVEERQRDGMFPLDQKSMFLFWNFIIYQNFLYIFYL